MVEMTGNVAVNKRGDSWLSKRVFFLTPQVKKDLESFTWSTPGREAILKSSYLTKVMGNDLSRGLFPAKEVKLLVVDEAHKAQGGYAYCLVARLLCCLLANIDFIPSWNVRFKAKLPQGAEQSRRSHANCCSQRHPWCRRAQREAGAAEPLHLQDRAAPRGKRGHCPLHPSPKHRQNRCPAG